MHLDLLSIPQSGGKNVKTFLFPTACCGCDARILFPRPAGDLVLNEEALVDTLSLRLVVDRCLAQSNSKKRSRRSAGKCMNN